MGPPRGAMGPLGGAIGPPGGGANCALEARVCPLCVLPYITLSGGGGGGEPGGGPMPYACASPYTGCCSLALSFLFLRTKNTATAAAMAMTITAPAAPAAMGTTDMLGGGAAWGVVGLPLRGGGEAAGLLPPGVVVLGLGDAGGGAGPGACRQAAPVMSVLVARQVVHLWGIGGWGGRRR
jgi:hypothetical protein